MKLRDTIGDMLVFTLLSAIILATARAAPLVEERANKFSFIPLKTPLSGPCDLVKGPDGALWGQDILVDKIFRIDPDTRDVSEYNIPFTTPISNQTVIPGVPKKVSDRIVFSCAIRNGTDGNLYAANGVNNQLVRINPKTKNIKVFQIEPVNPLGNGQPFNDLYSAQDGIWLTQTTGNVFQFFEFRTERFTTHQVPTPAAMPLGLFVASDKNIYIAELVGNKILKYNPRTKAMNEYALPELAQFPAVVRAERDGYVYFSLFIGNGIGRISMTTHKIDIFHTDQIGLLGAEDTIDGSGGVWLSSFTTDVLSRLDTTTLTFDYIPLPKSFSKTGTGAVLGGVPLNVDVAINYGPGNAIWFTSLVKNEVGRYSLD